MSFIKKALCVAAVPCVLATITACTSEETLVVPSDNGFNFEAETIGSLENTGNTYTAEDNGFSFNINTEAPKLTGIEPVKVNEAKIEFEVDNFELDFSLNVYEADLAKFGELTNEEKEILIEKKESFLSDLIFEFEKNNINIEVDEVTGEIILDSTILFDTDKSEVSEKGKDVLSTFIKAYASVACDSKYDGFIDKILVEGHTDTDGSYDYNKNLSEKRAENVLKYSLSEDAGLDNAYKAKLEKMAQAVGCSYDRPVKDASGNIDKAASRRVTFRFLINI